MQQLLVWDGMPRHPSGSGQKRWSSSGRLDLHDVCKLFKGQVDRVMRMRCFVRQEHKVLTS